MLAIAQPLPITLPRFRREPAPSEYRPVTSSPHTVRELESILTAVQRDRSHPLTKESRLSTALRAAIDQLKAVEQQRSAVRWVLAALRQSMRKPSHPGGMWVVIDRDLHDWALGQVAQLVDPPDEAR